MHRAFALAHVVHALGPLFLLNRTAAAAAEDGGEDMPQLRVQCLSWFRLLPGIRSCLWQSLVSP